MPTAPLVLVPCDALELRHLDWSATPSAYCDTLASVGLTPVQVPTLATPYDLTPLFDVASGILLTGARSNVHPTLYGQPESAQAEPFDPLRDAVTMRFIAEARARDLPLFGICRGVQELNVGFGGTLHPEVDTIEGRGGHYETPVPDLAHWFRLKHTVKVHAGGILEQLYGAQEIHVNSAHHQAIEALGEGLFVEAEAPDGTVEAVSAPGYSFILGVQWHPEQTRDIDPPSLAILERFAAAVRARMERDTEKRAA